MERILFISRKFPPSVGGMQRYSARLYEEMQRRNPTHMIALGRGQTHLIWFLPWSLFAGLAKIVVHRITHLHLGDALLSPIGALLGRITGITVSATVHGLDVIYPRTWYQRLIRATLPRLDVIVSVSRATREACLERGVSPDRCHVVTSGTQLHLDQSPDMRRRARESLKREWAIPVGGEPLVVALGRHIPRKGFVWLVSEVAPLLPEGARVVIAGDGPCREPVEEAVARASLQEVVVVTGFVEEPVKQLLLQAADVFAMPNRSVPGDMEGFGLVAIEAGALGTPTVATDIEGIPDAILDQETGRLVAEGDAGQFVGAILEVAEWDRGTVKRAVEREYGWRNTYKGYAAALGWSRSEADS